MSRRGIAWLCVFSVLAGVFLVLSPMAVAWDALVGPYAALVEADALIRRRYVSPPAEVDLADASIEGLVGRLDRYSRFVRPEGMGRFERRSRGEYVGVGLEVGIVGNEYVVIVPVDGGPAAGAGVRSGDVIEGIDGQSTSGMRLFDVEERLAGAPGSSVRVVLRRGGQRLERTVVRRVVRRAAVRGIGSPGSRVYWADGAAGIAYVRLTRFSRGAVGQLEPVVDAVVGQGAAALILDLRFNPGGLTDEATALVDRFVDEGVILSTINRRGAIKQFVAAPGTTRWRLPVVVLINGASASSAEIVAGALQDHGRAVLVGERTFGKGSVQDFVRLHARRGGLRLTVGYYELPSGRRIHRAPGQEASAAWGVFPDVPVPLKPVERARLFEVLTFGSGDARGGVAFVDRQLEAAVAAARRLIEGG